MPRPRVHPPGTTPTERKKASVQKLRDAGGKELHVSLSAAARRGLKQAMAAAGDRTATGAINRLLEALAGARDGDED